MSQFNYRAAFANASTRLNEIAVHMISLDLQSKGDEITSEMVQIAACSTLKGVEQKSIAVALIVAKWCESGEWLNIVAAFDFSKVEAKDLRETQAATLVRCAGQAYAVRQWATLTIKTKA